MPKQDQNTKLKHVIELLKLASKLDDQEVIHSTIESVIEILTEIVE